MEFEIIAYIALITTVSFIIQSVLLAQLVKGLQEFVEEMGETLQGMGENLSIELPEDFEPPNMIQQALAGLISSKIQGLGNEAGDPHPRDITGQFLGSNS